MSAANKIVKVGAPDETELQVAQALFDLETSMPDLKRDLRPLQFNSAREVRFLSLSHTYR
jgi:small subunit ribosomal protein S7e